MSEVGGRSERRPISLTTFLVLVVALAAFPRGASSDRLGDAGRGGAPDVPLVDSDPRWSNALRAALTAADGFLPIEFAERAAKTSAVHLHQERAATSAVFVTKDGGSHILLFEPFYFRDRMMVEVGDNSNDANAYLFAALFLAYAEDLRLRDAARMDQLREIAEMLFTDIPEDKRLEVYLDALAEMTGHVFSIAGAVERTHRKAGSGLCVRFGDPLFALWDRAFVDFPYHGAYWQKQRYGRGRWRSTKINMREQDRQWLVEELWAGFWTGDAVADFGGRYCPAD